MFSSVDPCAVNPCSNGGKCLSDMSKFTTSCSCPDGYEGKTCQNRGKISHTKYFGNEPWRFQMFKFFVVYPCDSSPCENNGTCENTADNFKCTCTEQYEGDTCESRGWFVRVIFLSRINVFLKYTFVLFSRSMYSKPMFKWRKVFEWYDRVYYFMQLSRWIWRRYLRKKR